MDLQGPAAAAAVTRLGGVLVVSLPPDLDGQGFAAIAAAVSGRSATDPTTAVVLDFSAVDVIGRGDFDQVRRLLATVRLLGAEPVIVSLAPELVLYLIEVEADTTGIHYCHDLDDALHRFRRQEQC